jgi:multidrug efflux pump subunit AcrA (membrane-fusion protein)
MTPPSGARAGDNGRALPGGGSARELIEALHALRRVPSAPDHDERMAAAVIRLCRAQAAWLLFNPALPGAAADWQVRASAGVGEDPLRSAWRAELLSLTQRAEHQGFASAPWRSEAGATLWWATIRLERRAGECLLLAIPDHERPQLNELLLRAQLVADLPPFRAAPAGAEAALAAGADQAPGAAAAAPADAGPDPGSDWAILVDITAQVALQSRFGSATLSLVNALAAGLRAQQVTLGWRAGSGTAIQAVAISHRDKFDRYSHPLVLTEDALDEALDHAEGVWLPAAVGSPGDEAEATDAAAQAALPAHTLLQQSMGRVHLLAIPLQRAGLPTRAVLLFAFDEAPLPPVARLRLQLPPVLQTLLPWLENLHERERPWALRVGDALQAWGQAVLGPQRLGWKALALAASLFLVYALFASWDYRVGANGQLATDSTRVLAAQFDGRVDEARVSTGQAVKAGELLAQLDVRDLRQQEIDNQAERRRYAAEADKARAANALADLEVASARAAQAEARLVRVQEMIAQAQHLAPFDAVVVEGDSKELQGAPVRKGDKLYRLARVEQIYATLQVPERDAALVLPGAAGELVLLSQPDVKLGLKVLAVVPVAQVKGQDGNQFLVRAELTAPAASWWRPGMSGVARIDAGPRQVAWILTHRLIDQARLWLWW